MTADDKAQAAAWAALTNPKASEHAGAVLFAFAAGDVTEFMQLVRVAIEGPGGLVGLITALSSVAVEAMHAAAGDAWQEQLNLAVLGLSIKIPGADSPGPDVVT